MGKILLLEPRYKNKYPSLGLMKLATYHQEDEVYLRKGVLQEGDPQHFDRVYVSSLFTFEWKKTVEAVEYAKGLVSDPRGDVFLGGVAATLLAEEFRRETGVVVVTGLLTSDAKIGGIRGINIDALTPDYAVLEQVERQQYKYPMSDAYIGYMTRGCKNNCGFCAVNTIEPDYMDYLPLKEQIEEIDKKYGPRKDLILNDNNVFASGSFGKIISEIKEMGFYRGAKFPGGSGRVKPGRYVDFNQGLDARFVTPEKMKMLSEIAIRPARIAFDDLRLKGVYVQAITLAAEYGIKNLSNYILYNYKDTPEEFFSRLEINVALNEKLKTSIYSFPMKYIPLTRKNRKYVAEPHWSKKQLRGVQCILNATMGKVGPKREFFHTAFGESPAHFKEIIIMPENYILYRRKYKDYAQDWQEKYRGLSFSQRDDFFCLIKENSFKEDLRQHTRDAQIKGLLEHYYTQGSLPLHSSTKNGGDYE